MVFHKKITAGGFNMIPCQIFFCIDWMINCNNPKIYAKYFKCLKKNRRKTLFFLEMYIYKWDKIICKYTNKLLVLSNPGNYPTLVFEKHLTFHNHWM